MAHFARLDQNNTVLAVHVVHNDCAPDEATGISFLTALHGNAVWKQTSYTGTIRKQFAGIGYTYDPAADVFISPQPFPSWTLDTNNDWQPPAPKPDGMTRWDEDSLAWVAV